MRAREMRETGGGEMREMGEGEMGCMQTNSWYSNT